MAHRLFRCRGNLQSLRVPFGEEDRQCSSSIRNPSFEEFYERTSSGSRFAAEFGGLPDRGRRRSAACRERLHLALEEKDTNSEELGKSRRNVEEVSWNLPFVELYPTRWRSLPRLDWPGPD